MVFPRKAGFTNNMLKHTIGALDTDVMRTELEHHSPVTAELEERIVILAEEKKSSGGSSGVGPLAVQISLVALSFFI